MRRFLLLVLVALASGCGGSGEVERETATETTPTSTASETTATETQPNAAPTSVEALLATLPPFDVPASPEVDAYRRASIGAFYARCVTGKHGADKASFVRANVSLLDQTPVFPGAEFVNEFSIDHRDGNGCPEGLGPPTSYTTYRNYRLPAGAEGQNVIAYYERRLSTWSNAGTSGQCQQTFTRDEAYVAVSACNSTLSLTARARGPVSVPPPPALPPRPTGEQYPLTTDDPTTPDPEPTEYSVEPGTTCERSHASGREGVVPIILPPPPGVKARIDDKPLKLGAGSFDRSIVVEWSLGTVHGDCPPSELILSYPTITAFTIHERVHTKSGVARMPLLEVGPRPKLLRATAVSVDGHHSRQVAVLIRGG